MTGAAAYFSVEKPYFFGERPGRVEFPWLLNGNAIERDADRMVRQRIETAPSPLRHGAKRSIEISIVTLDTLQGINVYSAVSGCQAI